MPKKGTRKDETDSSGTIPDELFRKCKSAIEEDNVSTMREALAELEKLQIKLTDIALRGGTDEGETLLHQALNKGSLNVAEELVDVGDCELITAKYVIKVRSQKTSVTCLHIIAEADCQFTDQWERITEKIVKKAYKQSDQSLTQDERDGAIATDKFQYYREFLLNEKKVLTPTEAGVSSLTCLHLAVMNEEHVPKRKVQLFLKALKKGVTDEDVNNDALTINQTSTSEETPLQIAVIHQNLNNVSMLLSEDFEADVDLPHMLQFSNTRNACRTALHYAAINGDYKTAELLLKSGAKIDREDLDGETPLMHATRGNYTKTMSLLLKNKADIFHMNEKNETVWDMAVEGYGRGAYRFLLDNYEKYFKNGYEKTSTHLNALQLAIRSNTLSQSPNTIKALVNLTENLNAQSKENGRTALHYAAIYGRSNLIRYLVKVDISIQDLEENTALHVAAKYDQFQTLDELLQQFEEEIIKNDIINLKDKDGETLLHIIVKKGLHEYVEKLVHLGANLAAKDNTGNTVLHDLIDRAAEDRGNMDTYLLVAQSIYDNAAIWYNLRKKDKESPSKSSEKNISKFNRSFHAREKYQLNKDKKIAVLHLRSVTKNKDNLNALFLAVKNDVPEFVKSLLSVEGAFLESKVKDGKTELTYDVTNLFPQTMGGIRVVPRMKESNGNNNELVNLLDKKGQESGTDDDDNHGYNLSEQESLLSFIAQTGPRRAYDMLNYLPLRHVCVQYYSLYKVVSGIILFIHFLYMLLFSISTTNELKYYVEYCYENRTVCEVDENGKFQSHQNSNNTSGAINTGITLPWLSVFLIWPFVLLLCHIVVLVHGIVTALTEPKKNKRPDILETNQNQKLYSKTFIKQAMEITLEYFLYYFYTFVFLAYFLLMLTWFVLYMYKNIWQGYFLAVTFLFGWLYCIKFSHCFEPMHKLTTMLRRMFINDVFRYLALFGFMYIGYSFAFLALIRMTPELNSDFPTIKSVFFETLSMAMGAGELIVEDIHDKYVNVNLSSTLFYCIYVSYAVITVVILLNVLIAMMNDSYQRGSNLKPGVHIVDAVDNAIQVEKMMPRFFSEFDYFNRGKWTLDHKDIDGRWYMTIVDSEARFLRSSLVNCERSSSSANEVVASQIMRFITMREERMMVKLNAKLDELNGKIEEIDEELQVLNERSKNYMK